MDGKTPVKEVTAQTLQVSLGILSQKERDYAQQYFSRVGMSIYSYYGIEGEDLKAKVEDFSTRAGEHVHEKLEALLSSMSADERARLDKHRDILDDYIGVYVDEFVNEETLKLELRKEQESACKERKLEAGAYANGPYQ